MSSLPSPPFIDIPGIHNFRSAGDGVLVRRDLCFRSADPSKATEEGLQKMSQELGITTIFDLRSDAEIKRDGPEWVGAENDPVDPFASHHITRHWVPVFATQDYGPEQVAIRYKNYTKAGTEGFVHAYHDILLAGVKAYTAMFKHLAQPEPTPCLVHCTAGKDRTGVVIALLLMLMGMEDEGIAEEYSLTDLGLASLKPLFMERLLKNPWLEGNKEGVANMVSAKKETMLATLDMIRKEVGSAERYMLERCGMSEEEVERLKKNLRPAT